MKEKPSLFIRKAQIEDIEDIINIFHSARRYMRANNNYSQWSDEYPGEKDIVKDINNGNSFIGIDSNGEKVMTFAFILGEDPTYKIIKDGNWINDEPYGTIHRIASNGKSKGCLKEACYYCFKITDNIRIDTHENNFPMLKALQNLGFTKCGVIICRDGSPRIAFQKTHHIRK